MVPFLGPLLTLIHEIKKSIDFYLMKQLVYLFITISLNYTFWGFFKAHYFNEKDMKEFSWTTQNICLIKRTFLSTLQNFFATGLISLSSLLKFSSIPLLALCCVQRNRLTGNVNSHSAKHQLNFKAAKLTDANASKYISNTTYVPSSHGVSW